MAHMKELEKELEQLEGAVYSKPEGESDGTPPLEAPPEPGAPEAAVAAEPEPEEPELDESIPEMIADPAEEPEPEPVVPAEPEVTNEDWKKRFVGYKATSDVTIHGLRREVAQRRQTEATLIERVGRLEAELAKNAPAQDVFKGVFTDEEEELLGPEAISAVKKAAARAAEASAAPLRAKLEAQTKAERERARSAIAADKKQSDLEFRKKLVALVPDYETIDTNAQFAAFMKQPDKASGLTKEYIFQKAYHNFDVQRVAGFFDEFKRATAPPPNPIAKKVTPSNAGSQPGAGRQQKQGQKEYTQGQIIKFYEDAARGLYDENPKLRDRIEKAIDAQLMRQAAAFAGR